MVNLLRHTLNSSVIRLAVNHFGWEILLGCAKESLLEILSLIFDVKFRPNQRFEERRFFKFDAITMYTTTCILFKFWYLLIKRVAYFQFLVSSLLCISVIKCFSVCSKLNFCHQNSDNFPVIGTAEKSCRVSLQLWFPGSNLAGTCNKLAAVTNLLWAGNYFASSKLFQRIYACEIILLHPSQM